jgi:ribosomal protein S18 acetylase RimI-like enzyme
MTQEDSISIIPATSGGADTAAQLVYESASELFDFWFDGDQNAIQECFAHWWRRERGLFSHSLAHVALNEDGLLGVEIGYDRATEKDHTATTLDDSAEVLSARMQQHLTSAMAYLPFLITYKPPGAYYVQNLAVKRTMRGYGIGKRLLQEAFDRATSRGYESCHLDVAADSPAVRFYRSMGMSVLSESRIPRLEQQYGIPSYYRMVKPLS